MRDQTTAGVSLDLGLAKVLAQVLSLGINAYEAQEGTIAIPQTVAKSLSKPPFPTGEGAKPK
jgi:hypothetical protein